MYSCKTCQYIHFFTLHVCMTDSQEPSYPLELSNVWIGKRQVYLNKFIIILLTSNLYSYHISVRTLFIGVIKTFVVVKNISTHLPLDCTPLYVDHSVCYYWGDKFCYPLPSGYWLDEVRNHCNLK